MSSLGCILHIMKLFICNILVEIDSTKSINEPGLLSLFVFINNLGQNDPDH